MNGVQEVTIGNEILFCDKSDVPRPILPPDCCFLIFSQFYDLCHPDWKVTKMMILARFTWPKAGQNIKLWCQNIFSANKTQFQDAEKV